MPFKLTLIVIMTNSLSERLGILMKEKWEEYYTKDQLETLQRIELENLKVFVKFCKVHNLEYFLYGGTLLGAEKYGGMIPWDDDIDIAMPRESYERFVDLAENNLPQGWFIQTPGNCPKSPFPYVKLRREGTTYLEYTFRNLGIDSGIYIDIYPVDKIPDNEKLRKRQFKMVHRWIDIFVIRQAPLYENPVRGKYRLIKKIGKYLVCKALKVIPAKYCVKKYEYYMKMYNGTSASRYAALNSPNYNNIYVKLYPLKSMKFEDMNLLVPGDWKTHLFMRYGDYTKELNANERYGHVPYILNLGSFKEKCK